MSQQSAMLSGLNLACFSISRLKLEIEASEHNQDAIKVLNLRKDSNFLLTTVLWGNMGSNTLLALLSGSVLGGVAAFLFSTVFLTMFAEITRRLPRHSHGETFNLTLYATDR